MNFVFDVTNNYHPTFALQIKKIENMPFVLAELPYAYNALEPHIDALTMEIHHSRHHKAYTDNLNKAIAGTDADQMKISDILMNISKYSMPVRNNGGGYWNHNFFWESMSPVGGVLPEGALADAINRDFGSFDLFKEQFAAAGVGRFGSGWVWLIVKEGKLVICSTPNQDSPIMDVSDVKGYPILACDVWEHAYYLKYQNKRPDYLAAWWNVVNWDTVVARFSTSF